MEPSREDLIRVASIVFGPPTGSARNGSEIRFGSKGSKSLDLSKMVWRDHEADTGGGWVDLYRIAREPLPPRDEAQPARKIAMTYDYVDEDGRRLFQTVRFATGQPRFLQRRPDGNGGWIWNLEGARRVLYRLPELLMTPDDDLIWVVEGEKDVDEMISRGLAATCNPMGAGKWQADYSEALRGREVAVIADNDEPGRRHAAIIAQVLAGIARSVTIVELPGGAENKRGYDVSDYFAAGHTADELIELYRDTPSQDSPQRKGRLIPGSDFARVYEMPNWLIDGVLQRGRLYACTSLTNHGKTAVWLYNACMIQSGRNIAGLAVDKANVLYLAGENPTDLQGRMLGLMLALGLKSMPWVLPASFPMTEEELDRLRAEVRQLGIPLGLIVGDTAASFFPGDDENDNVQAAGYGRSLRSLCELPGNPAVLMLAHPVKNAAKDNLLPRGGGALLNELDGNLTLWSENLGEITSLHWQGKIRGPDFDAIAYRYRLVPTGKVDKRGRDDMTIIAEPIDDFEAASHAAQAVANEDAVLVHLNRSPEFSLAQIAQACGWVNDDGVPEKWKAQRAIAKLRKDGLIKQFRGKWIITDAGKKVLEAMQP